MQAAKLQTEAARLAIRLDAARDAARAAATRSEQLDTRILAAESEDKERRYGCLILPFAIVSCTNGSCRPCSVCVLRVFHAGMPCPSICIWPRYAASTDLGMPVYAGLRCNMENSVQQS